MGCSLLTPDVDGAGAGARCPGPGQSSGRKEKEGWVLCRKGTECATITELNLWEVTQTETKSGGIADWRKSPARSLHVHREQWADSLSP